MIRAPLPACASTGLIFDIQRYAIHDGPGIRTTVFFKGCPLRCRWCHNPESWGTEPEHGLRISRCVGCGTCVTACPRGAVQLSDNRPVTDPTRCILCGACARLCTAGARQIIGYFVSLEDLIRELERDRLFYDESGGGVTFSGGEPLMQADFLYGLLRECRTRDLHSAVDTSCYADPETIVRISTHADLFLCDLKHMDADLHRQWTGLENGIILDNMRKLASAGRPMIIRIPIVPNFNDGDENIEATGRFAASLESIRGIDILPYHAGGFEKAVRLTGARQVALARAPGEESMQAIATRLRCFGIPVTIGG